MSFNLPRNQKDLRFTGELRAAVDEQPKAKLGIPRARRTPQPGKSAFATPADVYRADPIPTPFAPPPIDVIDLDDDDDSPTAMLDRDGLDVLPGGFGAPRRKPDAPIKTPVPNFRDPHAMPKVILAPDLGKTVRPQASTRTPPLVVWMIGALLLAVVSYRVTPVIVAKADVVVKRVQNL